MLPICDLFTSIQGEGKYTGVPSIFIRVSGCNLRCVFKGSICDTPYSSFHPEKSTYTIEDVKKEIDAHPKVNHIVITGGEPLLYKNELEEMLSEIWEDRFVVTIETNGTLPPLNPLSKYFKVALYSISPKLRTSLPIVGEEVDVMGKKKTYDEKRVKELDKIRTQYDNLYKIISTARDYQLKFVYSGKECVEEIKEIYNRLAYMAEKDGIVSYNFFHRNHPNHHTMLMPEGITNEQLNEKRLELAEYCIENGWNYTDRLHIIIWGDKRGF